MMIIVDRETDPLWRQAVSGVLAMVERGGCSRIHFRNNSTAEEVGVPLGYVRDDALPRTDTIIHTVDSQGATTAFMLIKWDRRQMETLVFCADSQRGGSGKPVMLQALMLAKSRGKTVAKLHALNHVVNYYRAKYGYERKYHPQNSSMTGWTMVKSLVDKSSKKRKERPDDFPVGSVVWAKVHPYPWWPAQIQEPRTKQQIKTRHDPTDKFVAFYGSTQWQWVPTSHILPFPAHSAPRAKDPKLLESIALAHAAIAAG